MGYFFYWPSGVSRHSSNGSVLLDSHGSLSVARSRTLSYSLGIWADYVLKAEKA